MGRRKKEEIERLTIEAVGLYTQGQNLKQIQEQTGLTTRTIRDRVKAAGVYDESRVYAGGIKANENRKRKAESDLAFLLNEKGFEYLGGYQSKSCNSINIRCLECGEVFVRSVECIKKGKTLCPNCEHTKAIARKIERSELKAKEKAKEKAIREQERQKRELEKVQKKLDVVHTCEICGRDYTIREYMNDTGVKYIRECGVCSRECRRKRTRQRDHTRRKINGIKDNHYARARKYGCEIERGITMKKIIQRDGLQCAICGLMCNPGVHYLDPMYPSIDHIIPMSKGGGHTFNNVQIAHRMCNSIKSDRIKRKVGGTYETTKRK